MISIGQEYRSLRTYEKGLSPHPAIAVTILGARSLAGLMAYAQFRPNDIPIATALSPTLSATMPGLGFRLRSSVIASTQMRRIAVPKT